MLKAGVVQEVKDFLRQHSEGIVPSPLVKTIGFQEIKKFLSSTQTSQVYAQMIEAVHCKTWQYARRQNTWFRHQLKCDSILTNPCVT